MDLLVTADFRMTATCVFSDVVLPAATWYEKHDLSSTDMHPFVHSFNPGIPPPWETRTDWDIFSSLAKEFTELAARRLGVRRDVVAAPLAHDSADELAQPSGQECDWKNGTAAPVPGKTMPHLITVERDYSAVYDKFRCLGPLTERLGIGAKGIRVTPEEEVAWLRERNGPAQGGVAEGRPALENEVHACEAILALSGTTNGRLAVEGFRGLERQTGVRLTDLAEKEGHHRITFADTQAQPRSVITSPEWSGIEIAGVRRYAPFTINVERNKPWHTLTGRQHFYLDHDWMLELGEGLPTYRPPLDMDRHFGQEGLVEAGGVSVTLRYLTPHSKYSIHSEFLENLLMLTLFRGGPVIWMHPNDAAHIEVRDNDWVEAFNRNGVVTARACVSHRIPEGVMYMYHAKDRHLETPRSQVSGHPGGTDNSLTRIMIKPSHLIGGYAQFSYGFNYYGPTGSQRDELASIRKLPGKVVY